MIPGTPFQSSLASATSIEETESSQTLSDTPLDPAVQAEFEEAYQLFQEDIQKGNFTTSLVYLMEMAQKKFGPQMGCQKQDWVISIFAHILHKTFPFSDTKSQIQRQTLHAYILHMIPCIKKIFNSPVKEKKHHQSIFTNLVTQNDDVLLVTHREQILHSCIGPLICDVITYSYCSKKRLPEEAVLSSQLSLHLTKDCIERAFSETRSPSQSRDPEGSERARITKEFLTSMIPHALNALQAASNQSLNLGNKQEKPAKGNFCCTGCVLA